MKTPFQHFIQLAQRVLDATNQKDAIANPCQGVGYLSDCSIRFDYYPFSCRVQIITSAQYPTSVDISFTSPLDSDCDKFDELFEEWTKNVDEFLASDSILLLDNQIKAGLRK